MRIVITGANGFLGSNLKVRLMEAGFSNLALITRESTRADVEQALTSADFVFHLAGVNRPKDTTEFEVGNARLTIEICETLRLTGRTVPLVLASSTQASQDSPYGRSKRQAEDAVFDYAKSTGANVRIFRLTNVFGKWSRPNYNSAVATFCHNIARGLPVSIHNASSPLQLVYVDDVVSAFLDVLQTSETISGYCDVQPIYDSTVGQIADAIASFADSRQSLITPAVGTGLLRALHATYLSFLPENNFAYVVAIHTDPRGEFVEMLKTIDSGQFSYFTAHPGVTRGEHYHHTKTEKFLVIRGTASFGFRNVVTGATHELVVKGGEARIVETAPGWAHNVANVGDDELIVMLWANEIFDRDNPDTIYSKVAL